MTAPTLPVLRGPVFDQAGRPGQERDADGARRAWKLALEQAQRAGGFAAGRTDPGASAARDAEQRAGHGGATQGTSQDSRGAGEPAAARSTAGSARRVRSRATEKAPRAPGGGMPAESPRWDACGGQVLVAGGVLPGTTVTAAALVKGLENALGAGAAHADATTPRLLDAPAALTLGPSGVRLPASTGEPRVEALAPDGEAGAARPSASAAEERPGEPVRWHAEWTSDGLRLWLGLDLGLASSLGHLVEPLLAAAQRRAAAQGTRLLSFVCNGRTLHEAPATDSLTRPIPEETP
jgi:hypothetical protein